MTEEMLTAVAIAPLEYIALRHPARLRLGGALALALPNAITDTEVWSKWAFARRSHGLLAVFTREPRAKLLALSPHGFLLIVAKEKLLALSNTASRGTAILDHKLTPLSAFRINLKIARPKLMIGGNRLDGEQREKDGSELHGG